MAAKLFVWVLALWVSAVAADDASAGAPDPGRWEVRADLRGVDVIQRHEATLKPELCGADLLLDPDGHPTLRLSEGADGLWTGVSESGGCTTRWRLEGGGERMRGSYAGQCPGGSMSADVAMRRIGPLPEGATEGLEPAGKPDVPDDWLPDTEGQGEVPHAVAVRTVERILAAQAGGGVRAARALSGYVWPKPFRGTTHVGVWLTAGNAPRLHQSLLSDPCDRAKGGEPGTYNEPARYLLNFKLFRHPKRPSRTGEDAPNPL
ncbi:hypothetical protein CKO28_01315 [Rhodovibrio sodomensis]|uniref:Uncharacterized protein n=1 Tax=Rhodovibrio sodomensis TaxID=1088 RepID=A0ABS1DAC1_9PROT|nr:hypothetical protein [Rhodovibrio sodomensis]MBK1666683.1 hypothetical protein [Rhodovibrio sodomensis]